MVEHSTVNRVVTGSSPVRGAIMESCPSGRRSTIGNRVYPYPVSRVRIPSSPPVNFYKARPVGQVVKTPPFHGGNRGSSPLRVTIYGGLAQLGEHLPYKQRVGGSIPSSSTIISSKHCRGVEQLAARRAHNPKVTGSSPVPATKFH